MRSNPCPPPACVVCTASRLKRISGAICEQAWLCDRCGHTFVGIVPDAEQLGAIYDFYGYDGREDAFPSFLRTILGELIGSFESYRTSGRLLDVGFGAGLLLREARARDWDTYGVELSRAAVEQGRAASIGKLHEGNFLEAPLERGAFDVIVMTELIEHLPDPLPFLKRAAELLRPGGLLYLTTPHGRGLSGRILGGDWSVLRPPEHLHLFSVASAEHCIKAAGFSESRVYTQGLLPHELVAKLKSKVPIRRARASESGKRSGGGDRVTRSYALNAALMSSALGRALKRTTNGALRFAGLGDSLRVEAER